MSQTLTIRQELAKIENELVHDHRILQIQEEYQIKLARLRISNKKLLSDFINDQDDHLKNWLENPKNADKNVTIFKTQLNIDKNKFYKSLLLEEVQLEEAFNKNIQIIETQKVLTSNEIEIRFQNETSVISVKHQDCQQRLVSKSSKSQIKKTPSNGNLNWLFKNDSPSIVRKSSCPKKIQITRKKDSQIQENQSQTHTQNKSQATFEFQQINGKKILVCEQLRSANKIKSEQVIQSQQKKSKSAHESNTFLDILEQQGLTSKAELEKLKAFDQKF